MPRPGVVLCLRHACDVRATEGRRKGRPTPPHHHHPPEGECGKGGGEKRPPPPEDNAAGWGGRGRRVRDEPQDRARRGRAPCKPRRGDHRGCGRRIEGATEGATRLTSPPPCRGTKATPRAYDARATAGKRQSPPPPPQASAPPRVGVAGREGRAAAPRLQRGGHRGRARSVERAKKRATRRASHPSRRTSAVPRASAVPATCLRRRKGNEGAPPPPRPHLPHPPRTEARATGRWRGDKRDDGSGRRTPPPGTPAAGWRDRGARRPCPRRAIAVQPQEG